MSPLFLEEESALEVTSERSGKRATGILAAAQCVRVCARRVLVGAREARWTWKFAVLTEKPWGLWRLGQVYCLPPVQTRDHRRRAGGARQPGVTSRLLSEREGSFARGGGAVAVALGRPGPSSARHGPAVRRWQLLRVPQVVFLVATIQQNARSFLKDLNFADELPYTGCLATKFKQG